MFDLRGRVGSSLRLVFAPRRHSRPDAGAGHTATAGARRQCGNRQEAVGQLRLLPVSRLRRGKAAPPVLASRHAAAPWAGFSAYVRRPTNQMPLYTEKVVPNADLAHIYAYLQSRPAPPPLQSIPLLQK